MPYYIGLLILTIIFTISGCAVNPVTGERQLLFSSSSEDIKIGKEQYKPAQQSQGGQYILDPSLTKYIQGVGHKLAKLSDQPDLPYEFVVLNNSVPNAWALPSGKIAINRGLLLELDTEAQLAAVLSHEVVHAAARHGAQRMQDNMFVQAGLAGLGMVLPDNDYRKLVIGGAGLGAQLTVAKYGRDHELESDKFGMKYMAKAGYDLQGAVDLQEIFLSFSKGRESSWVDGLFASHPPSQERVDENKKHASEYKSKDRFTGKSEYAAALSYLKKKAPAYELADQANQKLAKKKYEKALSLINDALKIEPKESLFHSIQGDIYQAKDQPSLALKSHDKATELNPNQFSYFMKRGTAYQSLKQDDKAKADYLKSMELLPTSVAALELGNLFEKSGSTKKAVSFYGQAATAGGDIGNDASRKMALLEIHKSPSKYLKVKHQQDSNGPLLISIENKSPLEIKQLTMLSQLLNDKGKVIKEDTWKTKQAIKPKSRSRYYPIPVSYHLKPEERVRTVIKSVKLP